MGPLKICEPGLGVGACVWLMQAAGCAAAWQAQRGGCAARPAGHVRRPCRSKCSRAGDRPCCSQPGPRYTAPAKRSTPGQRGLPAHAVHAVPGCAGGWAHQLAAPLQQHQLVKALEDVLAGLVDGAHCSRPAPSAVWPMRTAVQQSRGPACCAGWLGSRQCSPMVRPVFTMFLHGPAGIKLAHPLQPQHCTRTAPAALVQGQACTSAGAQVSSGHGIERSRQGHARQRMRT